MEYVKGRDLRAVIRETGRLAPARVCEILTAVCDAVGAAHRNGVLHRDLKPENVLIVETAPVAKVLDFGVAKLQDEASSDLQATRATFDTRAGVVVGTPAYMAPEQLRGVPVDARADVFSLGVMAYEMLAGALPFGAGPAFDLAIRQSHGAPPFERPRLASIPAHVERAVLAALATDRDQRPAGPMDFAALLNGT
jgi:serine/threonine protein kinase